MTERVSSANPPHYRWNYGLHVLDGGLYMASQAVLNANAVLTTAIAAFAGPDWLISLMPSLMLLGLYGAPLFSAHWIDRLPRFLPLLIVTGFLQRLPILVVGLILIHYGDRPALLCTAIACGHLFAGICSGVGLPAWQQMFSRMIPARRRSSVFAYRYLMGSCLGLAGAWLVKQTLDTHPGPVGYGLLHFWAFGVLCLSLVAFACLRETPGERPPAHLHLSLLASLRAMPGLVSRYPQYGFYLSMSAVANGAFLLAPFLTIHCQQSLGWPRSQVGSLLLALTAGGVVGNLLSGRLGDRWGGKRVAVLGQTALAVTAIVVFFTNTPTVCWLAQFGLGFVTGTSPVGTGTLLLEIVPTERRSTALAVASLVQVASLLTCSALSTWCWRHGGMVPIGIAALVAALLTLGGLSRIREPRHLDVAVSVA